MNVVEIRNLVKKYNDVTALKNVSLSVEEGIIYGLIGPNGSGKSTLINIISGLLSFDNGVCTILGRDINKNKRYIKNNIGVVPQEYSFYDDLKVKENMELFGRLYGLNKKSVNIRSDDILYKLGLIKDKNKYPSSFSGGMKRRVNIACSLIHNPKILIMDEPTAGLDPISRDYVLDVVKKINKEGCTVIYTSHYMEEVEDICRKAAILNKGVLLAEGDIKEIKALVSNRNSINISIMNINDEIIRKINNIKHNIIFFGDVDFNLDINKKNIFIQCNNPSLVLEKLLIFCRENKIFIKDINITKSTLEETFLRLVKQ